MEVVSAALWFAVVFFAARKLGFRLTRQSPDDSNDG